MNAGERLLDDIDRFFALKQHDGEPWFRRRLANLQAFQGERLSHTHAALLADPQSAPAVRFLLDEVYGENDLRPVAADIRRATRKAMSLLPEKVMETSATVLEATLLTQELDEAMVELLGDALDWPVSVELYAQGYRELGMAEARARQLVLIAELGHGIDRYVKSRLVQSTFKLVRKPAHAAGFSNLYDFLERGFGVLKPVPSIASLLGEVSSVEQQIMTRLFDAHATPFELGSGQHLHGERH